jgi:hypothetical protein
MSCCIFKINFCRWWGLEHFILFDGALGNEIKNFDVSWGQKFFFLRWVVVGFERCLPTPAYIYFWNSPKLFL